jgi:riboflavin biosynthesis pyrimidine reductase
VLATLLDRAEGEALPLPSGLVDRYGGDLRFPLDRTHVFANFVSTIDGVVSFALPGKAQAALISGGHPADRFILALLRAVADAVIVGAGTLRQEPGTIWTPEHAFPDAAKEFAALRAAMKKPARPLTVLVTASGEIDLREPALTAGDPVLVLTSEAGARRLAGAPGHVRVRVLAKGTAREMVELATAESGGRLILTEGGPTLLGQFLRDGALNGLFLTIAPRIAGRSHQERRLALVEGAAFAPEAAPEARLLGVKAADDYLFLRFGRR